MPTVLESLLFEIGIDTKKLNADAKEAENSLKNVEDRSHKATQELEARGQQTGSLFKSLKEEAGGFFAMVASAYSAQKIASWAHGNMVGAESLGFMASNLGMATERLKAWQLAAEKNGGTAAGMTSMLSQASMAVAASQRGLPFQGQEEFFAQGGKQEDLQSVESYMAAVSRIIQRAYSVSPANGMNVARLLGITPESVNLLKQGEQSVFAIVKEQEKFAAVSGDSAKSAHETLNIFRDIGSSLDKIGTIMRESVNPQLKEMAEFAERAANAAAKHEDAIKDSTPHVVTQYGRQIGARAAGRYLPGILGKAGKFLAGPVGMVGSFLADPDTLATDEQEQAELKKGAWRDNAIYGANGNVIGWREETGDKSKVGGVSNPDLSAKQQYLSDLEKQYGLPAGVLDSVWLQESDRGKNMLSPAGAEGHFQFMPATWKSYGKGGNAYDFNDSSDAAARYIRDLLKQHNGNLDDALRWYNAGKNYRGSQAGQYSNEVQQKMAAYTGNNLVRPTESLTQYAAPTERYTDVMRPQPQTIDNSRKTEVSVNGPVTINTQATDAEGIKQGLADNMGRFEQTASLSEMGTY